MAEAHAAAAPTKDKVNARLDEQLMGIFKENELGQAGHTRTDGTNTVVTPFDVISAYRDTVFKDKVASIGDALDRFLGQNNVSVETASRIGRLWGERYGTAGALGESAMRVAAKVSIPSSA